MSNKNDVQKCKFTAKKYARMTEAKKMLVKKVLRGYGFYSGIQGGKLAYGTWNLFYIMDCSKAHMFTLCERKLAGVSSELQGFYCYS